MSKKTAAIIAGGAAAVLGACYGMGRFAFTQIIHRDSIVYTKVNESIKRKEEARKAAERAAAGIPEPVVVPDERDVWFSKQVFEEFSLYNVEDRLNLKGYLLPADEPSKVFVFCSHGYRNHGKGEFNYMAKFWHDMGYNVFLVDHRAAGLSEGKYVGFGYFEHSDSLKWLNFLIERFGSDIQIILHGVSMGSATVMMMSGDERLPENVRFTVADCGYTSSWNEYKHNLDGWGVPAFPLLHCADLACRIKAGYSFKDTDALARVKQARVPILFIHGGADNFVPTYMGKELYDACTSEKDLLIVEGAEHAMSYRTDSAEYEKRVKAFADRFLEAVETVTV